MRGVWARVWHIGMTHKCELLWFSSSPSPAFYFKYKMNDFYETGTLTPSITRKNETEEVKYLLRPQQMSVGAEIQTQTCWLFSSHSFHCAHSSLLVPWILDHMKVLT